MNRAQPHSEQPDGATITFLKCAFPDGLEQDEYYPLLSILLDDMTLGAASWLVGVLLQMHYLDVYNDAQAVKSSAHTLDVGVVAALMQRLEACGYKAWLEAEK